MDNVRKENNLVNLEKIIASSIDYYNKNQPQKSIKILENHLVSNSDPKLYFTLGNLYLTQGNYINSIKYLKKASELAPRVAEIYNNLSNAYLLDNDLDRAESSAIYCININRKFPEAWVTLANIKLKKKNVRGAINSLKKALEISPDMHAALINLGNIYFDLNNMDKSLEFFKKATELHKDCFEGYNGIGLVHDKLGKADRAIFYFNLALKIKPDDSNVLGNLANAYQKNENTEDALALYREALHLDPNNTDLLGNFSHILQSIGRNEEANLNFKRALSIDQSKKDLMPYLINSELELCNWENYNEDMKELNKLASENKENPIPPFCLANSLATPKIRQEAAYNYSTKIENNILNYKNKFNSSFSKRGEPKKIKIGYISPDFREHSLGESFLPIIKNHDKKKYDIHGFASRVSDDKVFNEIKLNFHSCHDISKKNSLESAKIIYDENIDILIDLAGHTRNNALEILLLKPAPIQAHYLGYGTTLGSKKIDWLITDKIHTPDRLFEFCNESIMQLPNSFMSAEYLEVDHTKSSRTEESLPIKNLVFANFNSPSKFDPKSFKSWMKIIKSVPGSVLWLKNSSELTKKNISKEAENLGVNSKRLIFAERKSRIEHIERLKLADICLDNFLHNGGVSTIDALIAGVPVITLKGINHSERTGSSILSAAGLQNCIAENEEQYIKTTIDLALDKIKLNKLNQEILKNVKNSPLFNSNLLCKNLESSYKAMYQFWKENYKPKFFQI